MQAAVVSPLDKRPGINPPSTSISTRRTATRLQHFPKIGFVDDFYAEFFRLVEFATRLRAR